MTTIAVSMVKDEADIVAATVGHMLTQVDQVIVADNGSTDGTRDILKGLGVEVVDDPDPAYYQSIKVSRLAAMAFAAGADWVIPFDADEFVVSRFGRLGDVLNLHPHDVMIVKSEVFDHMVTGFDDLDEPDPTRRMVWRRPEPLLLPKVACRAACGLVVEQGNHWASYPVNVRATDGFPLTTHHFPYRSLEQFIRKVRNGAAAYKATEGLPPETGAHWRKWGEFTDEQLAELFNTWYRRDDPTVPVVIEGEVQAAMVRDPVR